MKYKLKTKTTIDFPSEEIAKAFAESSEVGWRESIKVPVEVTKENPTGIESTPNPKTWQEALEEHLSIAQKRVIMDAIGDFTIREETKRIKSELEEAVKVEVNI